MNKRLRALLAATSISVLLAACGDPAPAPNPTAATDNPAAPTNIPVTNNPGGSGTPRPLVVSSKNFAESEIIAQMYAYALENVQIPVDRSKMSLGTTDVAHPALLRGGADAGIDLYPEYTSTGWTAVLQSEPIYDPQQVYDEVKKAYKDQFKLTWLDRSPMNDTQALVTTQANSDKFGIKSLEDLCAKADQVTVAAVAEFKDRPDALPLLQKTYGGCNFKEIKVFDPKLRYQALLDGQADIAQAFSTDGEIAGNNLVLLEDPKNYGLPYNVAPVVRDDVLQMYPQLADALNKISPAITNEEISMLNWEVTGKGRDAQEVAKEWLKKKGLIQ
jgi:osmoprotectant transport system substrate-binding protein